MPAHVDVATVVPCTWPRVSRHGNAHSNRRPQPPLRDLRVLRVRDDQQRRAVREAGVAKALPMLPEEPMLAKVQGATMMAAGSTLALGILPEAVRPHPRADADHQHLRRPPVLEGGEARGSPSAADPVPQERGALRRAALHLGGQADEAAARGLRLIQPGGVEARQVGRAALPPRPAAAVRRARASAGCRAPSTPGAPPASGIRRS